VKISARADYFTNVTAMSAVRQGHCSVLLPNGKAMMIGGFNGSLVVTNGTETYDCTNRSWTVAGSLNFKRGYATATLLQNGKVLVAGGLSVYFSVYAGVAEVYDPSTDVWSQTGALNVPRYLPTATLLANGKVLLAGGDNPSGTVTNAELYDPATGSWTLTGKMNRARDNHTATLLPSGQVLVVGGNGATTGQSVEVYDPASGIWSLGSSLSSVTRRGYHTATLLPNGNVLVVGGSGNSTAIKSCLLYTNGTWISTGDLNIGRADHTATLLPSGKVLVAGGYDNNNANLSSAELYDPASGTWTLIASPMVSAQLTPQAVLLPNGEVLLAGGALPGGVGNNITSNAEVFVTAAAPLAPIFLNKPVFGGNGSFSFTFTNSPGQSFTVMAATNISLPISDWTVLGGVAETSAGQYQFIDSSVSNPEYFYRIRAP
jgi:N-acetylneuraminic acid mutarotase